jgi:cystathionine beta-synthase
MTIKNSILSLIGNTPMITINLPSSACQIRAKLEHLNPGGSIKDRAALYMVEEAERKGLLKKGGTIIEGSSGNQGIALAMIGALKGYAVKITVPSRTSTEKIATLKAYGAEVIVCDPQTGVHGYTELAQKLHRQTPNSFMPDQYLNPVNMEAHYRTTGPEIWRQTEGKVTHVIMAMGSCGTITGVGRYLKEQNPHIKIIGVDAERSLRSTGLPLGYQAEGLGVDVIEGGLLDPHVIDEIYTISDDAAFEATRKLAKTQGLLMGISSGAVMHITERVAPTLKTDDMLVILLADSGRAYLEKVFFPKASQTAQAAQPVNTAPAYELDYEAANTD